MSTSQPETGAADQAVPASTPTHVLLSVYGVVVNLFRFARHRLRAWHKSHCTAVSAMRRPAAALGALVVTCPVDNIVAFIGQDIDPAKDDRVGRRLIEET